MTRAPKDAKAGDKVAIELIRYPQHDQPAQGVIVEVLGETGQPDVETQAVIRTYGLAQAFDPSVVEDAHAVISGFDDTAVPPGREDLTGRLTCTIDPPDAKDFDDAINVDQLDPKDQADGAAFELGVHIADVSSFVLPNSPLDQEAYARGNSAYLPRKVIPMLPEGA